MALDGDRASAMLCRVADRRARAAEGTEGARQRERGMDIETVAQNVGALAAEFARQRGDRQRRRTLDPADFARLAQAGFLLTGVPMADAGLWETVPRSIRPIAELLRTLGGGDSSVALVCAMHPAVLSFWLATPRVPTPAQAAWDAQRGRVTRQRHVSTVTLGAWASLCCIHWAQLVACSLPHIQSSPPRSEHTSRPRRRRKARRSLGAQQLHPSLEPTLPIAPAADIFDAVLRQAVDPAQGVDGAAGVRQEVVREAVRLKAKEHEAALDNVAVKKGVAEFMEHAADASSLRGMDYEAEADFKHASGRTHIKVKKKRSFWGLLFG